MVEHAYSTWLVQLLGPLVTRQAGAWRVSGFGRWKQDLHGALGLKRLAYSRIDLSLCCSISLHLKGTWETQNHQTFCVSLVLVSFTLIYRAACPFLVQHSTIITSEESLRDSKLPLRGLSQIVFPTVSVIMTLSPDPPPPPPLASRLFYHINCNNGLYTPIH